jgi:hypothetical protein
VPKACLGLINTLFSVRIQGLFGLSQFRVSFEWTSYKSFRVNFSRTI